MRNMGFHLLNWTIFFDRPELYKSRVLELNASDDRGINVVRTKIKNFAAVAVGSGRQGYTLFLISSLLILLHMLLFVHLDAFCSSIQWLSLPTL